MRSRTTFLFRRLAAAAPALLVALGLVVSAAPASAAQRVRLQLEANGTDVVGQATAYGLPQPPSTSAGRAGVGSIAVDKGTSQATGRRTYEPIRLHKRLDASTPALAKAYEGRVLLPLLQLEGTSATGRSVIMKLLNVRITSYHISENAGDVAMESLTLSYEEVEYE